MTAELPKARGRFHWTSLADHVRRAAAALGCMNPSTPVDYLMNLGRFRQRAELAITGEPRLVVLQHGLWRSAGSLWKLERALRSHGYRTLNVSYPSTTRTIDDHARLLHRRLEQRLRREPTGMRLYFVGHSMGGLVVRSYLGSPHARAAEACVFLGTPHQGAVLCDLRRNGFLFRLLMGGKAALQLSNRDGYCRSLAPLRCDFGNVIGGLGDGEGFSRAIPGDDDGTVATAEAHCAGEKDFIVLPVGHTRISFDDRAIAQVLHFLEHRRFQH